MRKKYLLLFYWAFIQTIYGQHTPKSQSEIASEDKMPEIIISGTRSERKIEELPIPAQVISRKQIHSFGSIRLKDILQEQIGLNTALDPHGNDLQIQGLQSQYILFMIDGEPLIGRSTGILDTQRISLANIERIEIIKGPNSALYGSDALGGIINLITTDPKPGTHGNIYSRYSRNLTWDTGVDLNYRKNNTALSASVNHYQTNGYNLTPEAEGKTVYPNQNHTLSAKILHRFSPKDQLRLSARWYFAGSNFNDSGIQNNRSIREQNFNGQYTLEFTKKWNASLRLYQTVYKTRSDQQDSQNRHIYKDRLTHEYYKPELISSYRFNEKNIFTLGAGLIHEAIQGARYPGKRENTSQHLFAQYEWKIFSKLNTIAGARWDANRNYGAQFSPKLAVKYDINPNLNLKFSIGKGFRAPDFRTLYINLLHPGGGLIIYGVKELSSALERLEQEGKINRKYIDQSKINATLKPEHSLGVNIGAAYKLKGDFNLSLNFFRNDLKDMIDIVHIATTTNNERILSYTNLKRTFTQGFEIQTSKHFLKYFHLSAGYQYLDTGDKDVIEKIKRGEIHWTSPKTLVTKKVKLKNYGGLFNRSRHSANVKLFFEEASKGLYATLRMIYRGRYAPRDQDGNGIPAGSHEYVKGYALWHVSVGKRFSNGFEVQLGCDNLFDYTDKRHITDLFGRAFWGRITYQF